MQEHEVDTTAMLAARRWLNHHESGGCAGHGTYDCPTAIQITKEPYGVSMDRLIKAINVLKVMRALEGK